MEENQTVVEIGRPCETRTFGLRVWRSCRSLSRSSVRTSRTSGGSTEASLFAATRAPYLNRQKGIWRALRVDRRRRRHETATSPPASEGEGRPAARTPAGRSSPTATARTSRPSGRRSSRARHDADGRRRRRGATSASTRRSSPTSSTPTASAASRCSSRGSATRAGDVRAWATLVHAVRRRRPGHRDPARASTPRSSSPSRPATCAARTCRRVLERRRGAAGVAGRARTTCGCWKTRADSLLEFDDTAGAAKVTLVMESGHKVVLDDGAPGGHASRTRTAASIKFDAAGQRRRSRRTRPSSITAPALNVHAATATFDGIINCTTLIASTRRRLAVVHARRGEHLVSERPRLAARRAVVPLAAARGRPACAPRATRPVLQKYEDADASSTRSSPTRSTR